MKAFSEQFHGTKKILTLTSIICTVALACIDYDNEFKCIIILPILYLFLIIFLFDKRMLNFGLCVNSLLFFYAFRMCLQPVILALGNFWLETNKSTYIDYYPYAVLLTCMECLIVMFTVWYYTHRYSININTSDYNDRLSNHKLFKYVVYIMSGIIATIIIVFHIYYFYFFFDDMDIEFLVDRDSIVIHNTWYYIVDLLAGWCRPLLTFWLIYYFYHKYRDNAFGYILFIAFLNLAYTSDRRIFSILVGGFCFYFILTIFKSKKLIKITRILLIVCSLCVIFVLFIGYSDQGGSMMIARTVNRYFSGPTLTAMNLQIFDQTTVEPIVFFSKLHNTFQSLTSIFGIIEVPDYYYQYYGMSKGLWIPFPVGALRYFGILFPIIIVWFTWLVVRMDCKANKTSCVLYKMVYSYLGVTLTCYMIMYSLELIIYFLLSTVPLFMMLVYFDRKIKLSQNLNHSIKDYYNN